MSGRNRGGGNKRKKSNSTKTNAGKSNNKGSSKKKFDAPAFWGDPDLIPDPEGFEITSPDPVAVVNSLGQPPLPGHGAASPHYFKLVYTRATQLAGALGMASEIDDLTPDDPPEPETEAEIDEELDDVNLLDDDALEELDTIEDGSQGEAAPTVSVEEE
jgi:hypothetical protein